MLLLCRLRNTENVAIDIFIGITQFYSVQRWAVTVPR